MVNKHDHGQPFVGDFLPWSVYGWPWSKIMVSHCWPSRYGAVFDHQINHGHNLAWWKSTMKDHGHGWPWKTMDLTKWPCYSMVGNVINFEPWYTMVKTMVDHDYDHCFSWILKAEHDKTCLAIKNHENHGWPWLPFRLGRILKLYRKLPHIIL